MVPTQKPGEPGTEAEKPCPGAEAGLGAETGLSAEAMLSAETLGFLLQRLFDLSPVAMLITSTGPGPHRYVKANNAFLELTGFSWQEIAGHDMLARGAAINSPARDRRLRILDEQGGYRLEEVEIRHANGMVIPTLASSQRSVIDGVAYDIDVLVDISERVALQKAREQDLALAALTDGLTGLPNRMGFDVHLARRLADAGSEKRMALAFIDLNGFKKINDLYGHAVGDEALKTIAGRLRDNCRESGFAARIGGDEFAIALDVRSDEACTVEQHMQRIADAVFVPIPVPGGVEHPIGAAIGIALQNGPDDTIDDLFRRADQKMYYAKSTGQPVWIRIAPMGDGDPG